MRKGYNNLNFAKYPNILLRRAGVVGHMLAPTPQVSVTPTPTMTPTGTPPVTLTPTVTLTQTPTITPTNPFIFKYVTDSGDVVVVTNPEIPNYFIVTTTVATFSAAIDAQILGITNNYDIDNFANCNLTLNYGSALSANSQQLYVTQNASISSNLGNLYTIYYSNTGSIIVGFAAGGVYVPPITSYPPPSPTPTTTTTPTRSVTPTPSITPTITPTKTPTPTPTVTTTQTVTPTTTITPTGTPSPSNTPSVTQTPTMTPTRTITPTITPTKTPTPTRTVTTTQTVTPTPTPTLTPTVTPTYIPPVFSIYGTGDSTLFQFGLGKSLKILSLTAVPGNWSQLSPGPAVAVGNNYMMAMSAGTSRWFGVGSNGSGQLGMNSFTTVSSFSAVPGNWSKMVCSAQSYHTAALSAGTTDQWFVVGSNAYGALGTGNTTASSTFVALTGNWSNVVITWGSTRALSAGTSKWFGAGANFYGQLGTGTTSETRTLTAIPGNWSHIDGGANFSMALSAGTTKLFAAGLNNYGQLGLPDIAYTYGNYLPVAGDWSHVVCGDAHTLALSAGTTKWFGTGRNDYGQLGIGTWANVNSFTPWPPGGSLGGAVPGNWSQMACGSLHTMAMSAGTYQVFTVGYNGNGQLGTGTTSNSSTFVALTGNWYQMACGYNFSIALSSNMLDLPIVTPTPTITPTKTPTTTITSTGTPTPTVTTTQTVTPSITITSTGTPPPSNTPSVTTTSTKTPTPSITPTITSTGTPPPTPTVTPTVTPSRPPNILYAASYIPLEITNTGFSYNVSQIGTGNPSLTCFRGTNYDFIVLTPSHPFALRLASLDTSSAVAGAYNNNVSGGISTGRVLFTPTSATPASIVYQCAAHSSMIGTITIKDYL